MNDKLRRRPGGQSGPVTESETKSAVDASRQRAERASNFARAPGESGGGLLYDFWEFLRHYKKWWLLAILVVLILAGSIAVLSGSAVAPFIYSLF